MSELHVADTLHMSDNCDTPHMSDNSDTLHMSDHSDTLHMSPVKTEDDADIPPAVSF